VSAAHVLQISVELWPAEAAALMRLCEKLGHSDAVAYLYPHVAKEIRREQAYQMVRAAARLHKALEEAAVHTWPWIETSET